LLSTAVFWSHNRRYGQLEWLSLAIMTLAAFGFILLRERRKWVNPGYGAGSTNSSVREFGPLIVHADQATDNCPDCGMWYYLWKVENACIVLLAVAASAIGSLLAERIYKGRSLGLLRAKDTTQTFALQKVHLDAAMLLFSTLIWLGFGSPMGLSGALGSEDAWFGPWGWRQVFMVPVMVGQGWCAGLIAKRFSTVVKSIVQTLSTILAVSISDPLLDRYDFRGRALPSMALAMVLVLASLIFQTGRINLGIIRSVQARMAEFSLARDRNEDNVGLVRHRSASEENEDMSEYATEGTASEQGVVKMVSGRSARDKLRSAARRAAEKSSRCAALCHRLRGYFIMLLYVAIFVAQQLLVQVALSKYPIVNATLNFMTYVFGLLLANVMTAATLGSASRNSSVCGHVRHGTICVLLRGQQG